MGNCSRCVDMPKRFTHISLWNWRNFQRVDMDLQARVFLVGPNASGKSNFLDVFKFLRDIVSVGGGFQGAVKERGGVSSLRALSARKYSDIGIMVRLGNAERDDLWEYELTFRQDERNLPVIAKERVARCGNEVIARPSAQDEEDPERLTQTYLEQVNVNKDFREVADFLKTTRYLHLVPQLVREPDRSVGYKNDPYGSDFLKQVMGRSKEERDSMLRRIERALSVAVPQLSEIKVEFDSIGKPHLYGRYKHWKPQEAWQTEQQLSDGTLRLLGILWALLDDGGPLLLEEPELSLHPAIIRYVPQIFSRVQLKSDRQILISTHSSELLQDEGIGLDEVLLLRPSEEGTTVVSAGNIEEIDDLLKGGLSLADVVIPKTCPGDTAELAWFGE